MAIDNQLKLANAVVQRIHNIEDTSILRFIIDKAETRLGKLEVDGAMDETRDLAEKMFGDAAMASAKVVPEANDGGGE